MKYFFILVLGILVVSALIIRPASTFGASQSCGGDPQYPQCSSGTCGKGSTCRKGTCSGDYCCKCVQDDPPATPSPTPTPAPIAVIQGRRMEGCPDGVATQVKVSDSSGVKQTATLTKYYDSYQFASLYLGKDYTVAFTPPSGYKAMFSLRIYDTNHPPSTYYPGDTSKVYIPTNTPSPYYADLYWKCVPDADSQQSASKPDNSLWRYEYNLLGNITKETNPKGNITSFDYDALGRIVKTYLNGGVLSENTYDNCSYGVGRLCGSKSYEAGTANLQITDSLIYDARGQTKTASRKLTNTSDVALNNQTFTKEFTYDEGGRPLTEKSLAVSSISLPERILTYNYDRQYLVGISGAGTGNIVASGAQYSLDGKLVSVNSGSGVNTSYTYDNNNLRLKSIKVSGQNILPQEQLSLDYGYDPQGMITSINDLVRPTTDPLSLTQYFSYDALNQLKGVTGAFVANYSYDDLGNILFKDEGVNNVQLQYSNSTGGYYHRPQTGNVAGVSKSFTYDSLGNLTGDGQNTYEYDNNNRLTKVIAVTTASPTPSVVRGDANGDKVVDIIDYDIWRTNYNKTTQNGPKDGDFNSDTRVDLVDYSIWRNNYPVPTPTPGNSVSPTSQPTALPTSVPTSAPTSVPTTMPSNTPTPSSISCTTAGGICRLSCKTTETKVSGSCSYNRICCKSK